MLNANKKCETNAYILQEKSLLFVGILFLGPLLFTSFILNLLAASFGVTAALPLGTICVIVLVYILVSVTLLSLGGVFGHRYKSASPASPVTKKCPREIPSLAWYRKTPAQMFLAGLLPYSAIALELHHFYATIWGYKLYSSPGILFFTFVVLILITAILSVGLTYFQLAAEDHEWHWRYSRLHCFLLFLERILPYVLIVYRLWHFIYCIFSHVSTISLTTAIALTNL